ncbi:MAG: methionyl-tRNA formyltransferase [Candidatus Yanofskybacteria bacterium RIFCSPLOWO2_01_FULL_49_17]|uniref:Methionyl-tRNA formyltransferase n=1 Tax=Candidatus Yanofskybacteria bacterium RIFCSPLOWO2_01_FULL_49_17 TaxID=1802700 RepID=A0A1F8GQT4_9BACT|nr:MAG: methionyl-tRNA formyltransferase [Candidatus Yanofskybacteria bacterium RIFCSPLOWO2_01_FULL_49_17]
MKLIFFGTSSFAVPALKALREAGHEICAVVTQPDQPVGRKQVVTAPPIKVAAQELELKILQPESLKSDESILKFLRISECSLCVVAAYGKLIPKSLLEIPKYGFINIHPSLLPKYRGPSPIQTTILNGDEVMGVTIMKLDAGMDTGPMLAQIKFHPAPDETFTEIHDKLAGLGAELLIETIPEYIAGRITPRTQDNTQATTTKIFKREDGRIDWSRPARDIYNQIRALNPEPGTWTTWRDKVLNIKLAGLENNELKIKTLQPEGKKETSFKDFLNGYSDFKISDCK